MLVRPRPRVVVISTGSELVDPGLALPSPQQIFDSNSYLLAAAAKAAGAQVFRVGLVGDDPEQVKQVISDQLIRADLILTTRRGQPGRLRRRQGGDAGAGRDRLRQVAMQPGKPQGFGLIGDDRIADDHAAGQPGQLVRVVRGVRPAGDPQADGRHARTSGPPCRCQAAHAMTSIPGRRQLARGIVTLGTDGGSAQVELAGGHGSHLLGDLARANALVILPEDVEFVAAGDERRRLAARR